MKKLLLITIVLLAMTGCDGKKRGAFLETFESQNDLPVAVAKLESMIKTKGLTHFGTINHQSNAKGVEMALKPNTVVTFGNPQVGTLLIQCNPSMGLDLPLRMLFDTNYEGKTTITYTNPEYWSLKHNIKDKKCLAIVTSLAGGMRELAEEVAKK